MQIDRRIHVDDNYMFDLILVSKTVEAHSLMTDNASKLDEILRTVSLNGDYNIKDELIEMVEAHKEKLK